MKLHEYQAKEFFARYGLPIQNGVVIERPDQVGGLALRYPVVVKAQVLVGGRGKAGGIKLAATPAEAQERATAILGMDIKGERVTRVLVAEAVDIETEYYLAFVTDRRSGHVVAIASAEGGVEIETIAQTDPKKIARADIEPFLGFRVFQARARAAPLGCPGRCSTSSSRSRPRCTACTGLRTRTSRRSTRSPASAATFCAWTRSSSSTTTRRTGMRTCRSTRR